MGFSTKNKQFAFDKLGYTHCIFKVMLLHFQLDHPWQRKGCIAFLYQLQPLSWLKCLFFVFVALDLSTGNFVFAFFILEFWSSFEQHLPTTSKIIAIPFPQTLAFVASSIFFCSLEHTSL
jgi:hypothetical protein